MEIKYSFPIPGVDDLQARLMLNDVAITEWETAIPYEISGIHAGYIVEFEDVDADAVQWASASQDLADEKALPAPVDLGDMPEKIDFIYDKFTFLPPDRPALIIPAASSPEMVVLAVVLRDAPDMVNGALVKVTMREPGPVYIDGAHEVKKYYEGTTGEYDDGENVHQGVAIIELFASPKLENSNYNPLYTVEAPGVKRNVWVPSTGGELGLLPVSKPQE